MGAVILPIHSFMSNQSDLVTIGVCFAIGVLTYLLVLVVTPGGTQVLREFLSYIPLLWKDRTNLNGGIPNARSAAQSSSKGI
jgi:hypothetical protein